MADTTTTTTTSSGHHDIPTEYVVRRVVSLNDPKYFCNRSWTLSFNLNTKSWISFHSYIPNWYIGENNFFYSGLNTCCDDFDFIAATFISTTTTTTTIIICDLYAVVVDPYGTTTSTTTRPCSVTIELDGIECADTTTTTTLQPTTTTTTTLSLTTTTTTVEPTTTTTTTGALPYRASLSVGPGPDYNMATDTNVPYSQGTPITTASPILEGYNFFFVSVPTGRSWSIRNAMFIDVMSFYTAIGTDNRPGYADNTVYRKDSVFDTEEAVTFYLTFY